MDAVTSGTVDWNPIPVNHFSPSKIYKERTAAWGKPAALSKALKVKENHL